MVEPGQTLSHFKLLEKIGEGGIGVVFRAVDEHLDRDVALKVLRPGHLLDDAARKRFYQEALVLSKLSHPSIATVHDFDTDAGVDFLVMEYIPGTDLAAALESGPLPEKEIVALATQLLEGLVAAHDHGVFHRDLKPRNLRLTPDKRLKILDFGLAKILHPVDEGASAETITRTRAIVGTLPYMAPEQLRGEPVDARTDLYAAGIVLYEMATGQRPYRAKVQTALVDSILHQVPVPPRALNREISPDLERIILKCMEKDPDDRYQSAREIVIELRRLASTSDAEIVSPPRRRRRRWPLALAALAVLTLAWILLAPRLGDLRQRLFRGAAPGRIESLAVLPLENLMGDEEQQYFVDGMHEALIAQLAKIGALRVISRTSVMQYRHVRKPLPEIARDLRVDAVVEGSVLRAGERVRIMAQLVHAPTDTHLWAESYEGNLRNILELQSETARAIAREIRVVVTPEEAARLESAHEVDLEAYEAYLKGRYYLNQRTKRSVDRSAQYFRQSLQRDRSSALTHAALAEAYLLNGWYSWAAPEEAFPQASEAVARALAIDDTLAEAHTAQAAVHMLWDRDYPGAEAAYRRAIALNPSYPRAHHWYALFLAYTARSDEAIAEIRRAQELDPLSIIINTIAGMVHCMAGDYDTALREARKTLEMNPDFLLAQGVVTCAHLGHERYPEAIASAKRQVELSGGGTSETIDLAEAYALAGESETASALLRELEERSTSEYVSPTGIAALHRVLGQSDRALDWLERAYEDRAWELIGLGRPHWDPLRDEPRFQDLLRRVNLPVR